VILILYGALTNTSIGGLLLAGILPSLFVAAVMMVTTWIVARRHNFPRLETKFDAREVGRDTLLALPALAMPLIVLVTIVGGFATATEASAIAVVYSFLIGTLVYRELSLNDLYPAVVGAVTTTGVIMMI
ncbi:TRAP transporter large permease subunit, partial [Mesorhizobium sp. M4B.F.Ca.ET.089.01.1.1]|uniref:TRAP transporter large permease subunit n=1 Tax=Mesorhizobium sp. M4B.F.Ca.ET.089.01.1.1 TaxID=2496662 RepID=UPI000FE30D59